MEKIKLKLKNKTGLHARPASKVVDVAKQYSSEIEVERNDKKVNAKSLLSILSLGADCGDEIKIIASGGDEKKAIIELENVIKDFK